MRGNFLLFLSLLLLAACKPNKPISEQAKSSTAVTVEQQKYDALVILEAEDALLESAELEPSHAESLLSQRIELQSEHNEQFLIEMASSKQAEAEQGLFETAKLTSDKTEALLKQAANAKKEITDTRP